MSIDHTGVSLPKWLMDKLKEMVGEADALYTLSTEQKSKLLFLLCSCEAKAIQGLCHRECGHCTRNNTLYMEQYSSKSKSEHAAILFLIKEEAKLDDD